jgi:D-aminoacyl-tRNA deacylase
MPVEGGTMMPQGQPATVLVASATEPGSTTLAAALVRGHGFESTGVSLMGRPIYQKGSFLLFFFDGRIVEPPDLDAYFNPQAYIFLSKHVAESGIPSLTAHTTGNFSDKAEVGGRPREMGRTDPNLLKNYMLSLSKRREKVKDYEITMEATHHGPTSLLKPVLFVEIGSSEKNWGDEAAASVIADALMESLEERRIWEKVAIGFGGTHYPAKFNDLLLEGDTALSFAVPKHALENVDERMMGEMLQKTSSPVRYAALDWKGLGPQKERIIALVEKFGLEKIRL